MTELDNICWVTNNEYWAIQDRIINQLIYQPARVYRRKILSFKNNTILDTLDDLRLFTKKYKNPWIWYSSPITIPITFEEFLNNRSLSKYTQKASKEINYGNSNKNSNNN